MFSLLTPSAAAALAEDRWRQAAELRRARAAMPGVRWFRKPASERVAEGGDVGQAPAHAPCATCS
jgi:hypothetical protein